MSESNQTDGYECYTVDNGLHGWFDRQWRIWPKRADEASTTNVSFLYGGVEAFRELHGRDPEMSADYAEHVAYLDKHAAPTRQPRGGE